MANVNFGGISDYEAEQEKIKMQQLMAAEMIKRSLQQNDPGSVGGIPVKASPMAGIAQLAQAFMGQKQMTDAAKAKEALAQRQQGDAMSWIQALQGMQQGTPAQPGRPAMIDPQEAQQSQDQGTPLPPPIAPTAAAPQANQMQLMAHLLGGVKNPQAAPIANAMLAQMMKGKEYSDTPRYDQQGRAFVVSKDGTIKYLDGVKARDKMEAFNFGGHTGFANPYDIQPGTVERHTPPPDSPLTVANKPFLPSGAPNTAYQQYETGRARAGAPRVSLVNQAEGAYAKDVSTKAADRDSTQFEAATAAVENKIKLDSVIQHLKTSNTITGMGADLLLNIERTKKLVLDSKAAGKTVSDTELLDTYLGSDVFPMIKALGIGARGMDTPAEREFLRKVMTGTINLNKDTLIKMTEIRRDIADRAIKKWNERVQAGEVDNFFKYSNLPKRPIEVPTGGAGTQSTSGRIRKYNPATGKIE